MNYKLSNDIDVSNEAYFNKSGKLIFELNKPELRGVPAYFECDASKIDYLTIQVRHNTWYLEFAYDKLTNSSRKVKYYIAVYTNKINCVNDYKELAMKSQANNELLDGLLNHIESTEFNEPVKHKTENQKFITELESNTIDLLSLLIKQESKVKLDQVSKKKLIEVRNKLNEFIGMNS